MVSRFSVASQYSPLYLVTWVLGKEKETILWLVLGGLTTMAMLLALTWLEHVWCAMGCVPLVGLGALTTLVGGAHTVGAGAGVCMHTFGVDSGVGVGAVGTPLELMQRLELAGCLVGRLWAS